MGEYWEYRRLGRLERNLYKLKNVMKEVMTFKQKRLNIVKELLEYVKVHFSDKKEVDGQSIIFRRGNMINAGINCEDAESASEEVASVLSWLHKRGAISEIKDPSLKDLDIETLYAQRPFFIFTLDSIRKLERAHVDCVEDNPKITIFISKEKGITRTKKDKLYNYPISGKRAKLMYALQSGRKESRGLVEMFYNKNEEYSQNLNLMIKEIGETNKTFKSSLKINNEEERSNFIINIPTRGYNLNHHYYEIEFT